MYTLYYLSKNEQMSYLKIDSFDVPVLVPEDLVFCALRKGINFIKEPHECIDFTDNERLFMHQEFTDTRLVKDGDFRRANTYLTALCPVEPVSAKFITIKSWSAEFLEINLDNFVQGDSFKMLFDDNGNGIFNEVIIDYAIPSVDSVPFGPYVYHYNEGVDMGHFVDLADLFPTGTYKLFDLENNLISNIYNVQV